MKKIILLAILAVALVSTAAGNSISSETVEIDLEESTANLEIEVNELSQNRFNYYVQSYQVESVISGQINGEEANCYLREEQRLDSQITCDTDLEENFTVNLVLEGSGWVTQQATASRFQHTQNMHNPTEDYTLRVILPIGASIISQEDSTEPVIFPDVEPQTTGQRIYIEWNENPGLGELLNFQILFEENNEPSQGVDWRIIGSLSIILLFLGGLALYIYRKRSENDYEHLQEILNEDEMLVVDQIYENDGEILQKDIVNQSEYSKAKVSGIVGTLVDKEIITKEKEGRSNKLVLTERYQ